METFSPVSDNNNPAMDWSPTKYCFNDISTSDSSIIPDVERAKNNVNSCVSIAFTLLTTELTSGKTFFLFVRLVWFNQRHISEEMMKQMVSHPKSKSPARIPNTSILIRAYKNLPHNVVTSTLFVR